MATDWDACYRVGATPWDKGMAAPPLHEWLEQPAHRFHGAVLVPGCGFGHDVRAIAATGQAEQICGLDFSEAALTQARRFQPAGTETYLQADLFALPPETRGSFDWVFEHTCFCAIEPVRRGEYVRAVADALKIGGRFLAIFYLTPWLGKEIIPPEGGPPFGVQIEELDELFSERFRLLGEFKPTQAFPGREGRELVRLMQRVS